MKERRKRRKELHARGKQTRNVLVGAEVYVSSREVKEIEEMSIITFELSKFTTTLVIFYELQQISEYT